MAKREVYANAPLRLVAAELRYPYAPRLSTADVLQELTTLFRPTFPIPEPTGIQVVMSVGGGGQSSSASSANRFLARDRSSSVTVTQTNIVIETTDYGEYGRFRPMLETCLEALGRVRDGIVGVERVGLRYLNEIRVPAVRESSQWTEYLAANLVAPLLLVPGQRIALMQSIVQTEPVDKVATLVRFGALRGQVVSSVGPLRVKSVPPDEPFFLLDIDCSWSSGESFDEYGFEAALSTCDRLHAPIDSLFEDAITDKLREVFRRAQ